MFNTKEWSKLTESTYGYPTQVYKEKNFKIYYSFVKNEIGEYFVSPSFGDFISVDHEALKVIEQWSSEFPEIPIRVKVCCEIVPEMQKFLIKPSGFIHQIEFNSYDDWYENIVTYRFKRNIKVAKKNDLRVEIERDKKAVKRFWEMHANLRLQKFKEIPQPWPYFENIYDIFFKIDRGFIISAYDRDNILIAGILVLLYKDVAYYKFNASVLDKLSLRPNNLLIDRLIHYLSNINFRKLNLGFSGSSAEYEGLRTYKLSTGAKEFRRYTLTTPSFDLLDRSLIGRINRDVQALIDANPSIDEVDKFSRQYYKYFI